MHQTIHIQAVAGPDGTVLLTVPTGASAGEPVDVEVRIAKRARGSRSKKAWQEWVKSLSGSIQDPAFKRPRQPKLDPIPPL